MLDFKPFLSAKGNENGTKGNENGTKGNENGTKGNENGTKVVFYMCLF